MKIGGTRDTDITAFRHCLLEFDHIGQAEQWSLIDQYRIPATAVISSGGRSLHAWVRVDARDREQYNPGVRALYGHFSHYNPDCKNKNPSRFSRLPNCVRLDKRQELLSLARGAPNFEAWQNHQETAGLGQEIQVKDMLSFVPSEDPNTVLGDRWLCKGGSCLFIGQSGIGKSSLAMQMAILWSLGRPAFGIETKRPLKSLFVQAENDLGDLAEMFQGVWTGMNLPGPDQPETIRQVQNSLIIRIISSITGHYFCQALRRLIDHYKPDLVWVDPLLAYIGDDISKQNVCSTFLRNWLHPIIKSSGVILMLMHHTGKPPKDPKSKSHWNSTDFGYDGIGSSELQNYPRAICVLRRMDEQNFLLQLAKRGRRAGAVNLQNEYTTKIWLQHARKGICWQQIDEPVDQEDDSDKPHKSEPKKTDFDYDGFLESIKGEYFTATQLVARIRKWGKVGETRAWSEILPTLKERMIFNSEFRTYSV